MTYSQRVTLANNPDFNPVEGRITSQGFKYLKKPHILNYWNKTAPTEKIRDISLIPPRHHPMMNTTRVNQQAQDRINVKSPHNTTPSWIDQSPLTIGRGKLTSMGSKFIAKHGKSLAKRAATSAKRKAMSTLRHAGKSQFGTLKKKATATASKLTSKITKKAPRAKTVAAYLRRAQRNVHHFGSRVYRKANLAYSYT